VGRGSDAAAWRPRQLGSGDGESTSWTKSVIRSTRESYGRVKGWLVVTERPEEVAPRRRPHWQGRRGSGAHTHEGNGNAFYRRARDASFDVKELP
jgi:hypothetical protein